MLYYTILHYTILYYTILYYTILYYTILYIFFPLGMYLFEIKVERKWCTNTKWRVRSEDETLMQPKYGSLDGEGTECRLCKDWLYAYI